MYADGRQEGAVVEEGVPVTEGVKVVVAVTVGAAEGTASAATSPGDNARSNMNRSSIAPCRKHVEHQVPIPNPPTTKAVLAAVLITVYGVELHGAVFGTTELKTDTPSI